MLQMYKKENKWFAIQIAVEQGSLKKQAIDVQLEVIGDRLHNLAVKMGWAMSKIGLGFSNKIL